MFWVVKNGHEAIVKLLLEIDKVEVDSKNKYGQTSLWSAAEYGHEAIVKLLLEKGAEKLQQSLIKESYIYFINNNLDRESPRGTELYILWNIAIQCI